MKTHSSRVSDQSKVHSLPWAFNCGLSLAFFILSDSFSHLRDCTFTMTIVILSLQAGFSRLSIGGPLVSLIGDMATVCLSCLKCLSPVQLLCAERVCWQCMTARACICRSVAKSSKLAHLSGVKNSFIYKTAHSHCCPVGGVHDSTRLAHLLLFFPRRDDLTGGDLLVDLVPYKCIFQCDFELILKLCTNEKK